MSGTKRKSLGTVECCACARLREHGVRRNGRSLIVGSGKMSLGFFFTLRSGSIVDTIEVERAAILIPLQPNFQGSVHRQDFKPQKRQAPMPT